MQVTILGSGTSQGVPVIACGCAVCQSTDQKDKRLRCAILIETETQNIVVDTGPDFRQQMLRESVQSLDAVLFTHEHKDHVAGMDDVRSFNFKQEKAMDVYASEAVQTALHREFHYVFAAEKYPGVPSVNLHTIDHAPFDVNGETIVPIKVWHYKMPVLGFRVRNFAYVTDANRIEPQELDKLKGLDVLVVNALRKEEHISHFNLQQALELIVELQPKRAYLTHISHLMGKHADVAQELPPNVEIAYDGQQITFS